jgi:cytochrome c biogenesis protein
VRHLFARKGDLAQWGSVLFHFSFLVLLVGVVFVQLTRYVGTMVITEGQTVTERREDYVRTGSAPLLGAAHLGFQVRLEGFSPTYHQGTIGTDYAADLAVLEGGREVKRQRVRVNQPLTYRGRRFLLEKYGFAPLLVLTGAEERQLFEGYVNLAVLTPGSEDFFAIPGTSIALWARFYPDMVMVAGHPSSRSLVPANPVLYLKVTEEGQEVFQGPLPLKGSVPLRDRTLTFADLRYWTQYQVVRDPGKEVIFGGFGLGLLGLALRYLVTPKHVWAVVRPTPRGARLTIGGSAPQLDSLYSEEFISLIQGLRKEGIGDPL